MKYSLLFLFILSTSQVIATDYFWPGSCSGTLNQCVVNAENGDSIYIQSNDEINESLSIDKSISLLAVDGYSPTFAAGESIVMNIGDNLTIRGIEMLQGYIHIINDDVPFFTTDLDIVLENNIIREVLGETSGVLFLRSNFGVHDVNLSIKGNQINSSPSGSEYKQGLHIENVTDKWVKATIQENQLDISGLGSKAIQVKQDGIYTPNTLVNILANKIYIENDGILLKNESQFGLLNMNMLSNVIKRGSYNRGGVTREGLAIKSLGSTKSGASSNTLAVVKNNTIANVKTALVLEANNGDNDFSLYNNIIVRLAEVAISHVGSNNYSIGNANLIYRDSDYPINHLGYIAGAKDIITGDPVPMELMGSDFRLKAGSMAIDYGVQNGAISAILASIDADGLYRKKSLIVGRGEGGDSIVDIGAYEYGDTAVTTISSDSNNYYEFTALSDFIGPENQNLSNFQVTSNAYIGPLNNHHEGIYNFFGLDWAVFNQDEAAINLGASFNLIKIGDSSHDFRHVNTVEASSTLLNKYELNYYPDQILQVTQVWNNDSETEYNNHPIGVIYNFSENKWQIQNLDSSFVFPQLIPIGAEFNVYFQDPSQSAWKHQANVDNITGKKTLIDHLLLNNKPCAQLQVTQEIVSFGSIPFIYYNAESIGVTYDEDLQRWSIINQSGHEMPVGAKFHVLINPQQIEQTVSCPRQISDLIFANGFD